MGKADVSSQVLLRISAFHSLQVRSLVNSVLKLQNFHLSQASQ